MKILEDRNMVIHDKDAAVRVLEDINYYRFVGYALQFNKNNDYGNKTSFENVYKLYVFDKKLRHLILEILESIEISVRTKISYHLSSKYGSIALGPDIFKDSGFYTGSDDIYGESRRGLIDEIKTEMRNNRKELFIKHHVKNYNSKFPIWVLIEIFSFGMLSKTYANLKLDDQKEIARAGFVTNYQLLESWLQNLCYVRNICAHYGRLYNKKMSITPKVHRRYSEYEIDLNGLFTSILAIKELTMDNYEWCMFKVQLKELFDDYLDVINLNLIGFPENWFEIISSN